MIINPAVFGHSAIVRNDSQLIIVGGYHGTVTVNVLGYIVPSTLARVQTPCHLYGKQKANPKRNARRGEPLEIEVPELCEL